MAIDQFSDAIRLISIAAIPFLFAITLHESAHGWAAKMLGDKTAEMLGRISLNPLRHIDPVGTVILPVLMILFAPIAFGWAKPVPVSFANLGNPKRDMIFVALAGPGANLLMAIGWAVALKVISAVLPEASPVYEFLLQMSAFGILINVLLMIINLLPILPLDGGRVLRGLVPEAIGQKMDVLERFGLIIVIGLFWAGVLRPIIGVVFEFTVFLGAPLPVLMSILR